ncbi:MAG: hypothetical protein ACJAY2_001802 [Pseudomonadales bacterium]|jgi:hypothetical protein
MTQYEIFYLLVEDAMVEGIKANRVVMRLVVRKRMIS